MIKAIIFDLDDTLISEKQYIESGFSYIAKILSIKHKISEKALYSDMLKIFNENSRNVFNRLLDKYDINYSNEDILNFVNLYRTHNPEIQFCSDVIPLITFLKEKNIKTGIITDGNAESQRKKLKVLNAYEIFDKIIITDEYGKEYWKPHPKAFEDIRKFFNIEFNEIIYVGDNPEKDFYINSVYPLKTIRIIRQNQIYNKTSYYKDKKETYTINNLQMIVNIIN